MKTFNIKTALLAFISIIALTFVFAQNTNAAVFVTGDNNIIQIGTFVETTPGNVPTSIYYNQSNKTFYYTWYSQSKGYHILKAYDSYSYTTKEYWGTYYENGYTAPASSSSY
jgi:hypothetical protein